MSFQVLTQLEEAPLAWKNVKKKMYQRREQLAPLQQSEAIEVRRRSDAFSEKVHILSLFAYSNLHSGGFISQTVSQASSIFHSRGGIGVG